MKIGSVLGTGPEPTFCFNVTVSHIWKANREKIKEKLYNGGNMEGLGFSCELQVLSWWMVPLRICHCCCLSTKFLMWPEKRTLERQQNLGFRNQGMSLEQGNGLKSEIEWSLLSLDELISSFTDFYCFLKLFCPFAATPHPNPSPQSPSRATSQPPVLCCQWFDSAQSNYRGP